MIEGPEPVAGVLYDAAEKIFALGIEEGVFAADRSKPSGEALRIGPREAPVALLTLLSDPHAGLWVDLLWVAPEHRRKGHASALIAKASEVAEARGFGALSLGSLSTNTVMSSFCVKLGFKATAVIWARGI